ncbi:carbohydrate ABC transporter permease [Tepidibacillus infernus]|uniref:carbohydrate ABC transporter permease n=1 Tax=Tepidibacillus infernus TaxID=1806172 RepID=UPI003B72212E
MKRKNYLTSYLFLLPYTLAFLFFMVVPLIYGIYISLHDWELIGNAHPFIGFENYIDLFNPDKRIHTIFWDGLWKTIKFVIFSVPFLVVVGLVLALIIKNLPSKFKGFFRSIYFLPTAISVTVISVLWLWILDTNSGLINAYLSDLGIPKIAWLTTTSWAWVSIVVATIWWTVGFNMIIFQNALDEVPQSLYEAAEIDGAGSWQKFINITLPSIKNVTLFVFVTSTIASFNIFGQPFLMTRGGPGTDTKVLLMSIYEEAFSNLSLGTATSMAVSLSLIIMLVSLIQFRLMGKEGK